MITIKKVFWKTHWENDRSASLMIEFSNNHTAEILRLMSSPYSGDCLSSSFFLLETFKQFKTCSGAIHKIELKNYIKSIFENQSFFDYLQKSQHGNGFWKHLKEPQLKLF